MASNPDEVQLSTTVSTNEANISNEAPLADFENEASTKSKEAQSEEEAVVAEALHLQRQERGRELAQIVADRRNSGTLRPPRSKQDRAGINLPVSRIIKKLKSFSPDSRILTTAGVYLSAALECVAMRLFELAGNEAFADRKLSIQPIHVKLAIEKDEEMYALLSQKKKSSSQEFEGEKEETEDEDEEYDADKSDAMSESTVQTEMTRGESSRHSMIRDTPDIAMDTGKEKVSEWLRQNPASTKRKRSVSASSTSTSGESVSELELFETEYKRKRARKTPELSKKLPLIEVDTNDNILVTQHGLFMKITAIEAMSKIVNTPFGKRLLEITKALETDTAANKENAPSMSRENAENPTIIDSTNTYLNKQ